MILTNSFVLMSFLWLFCLVNFVAEGVPHSHWDIIPFTPKRRKAGQGYYRYFAGRPRLRHPEVML